MRQNCCTPCEVRCGHCGKLLAKGSFEAGTIELHCSRCKTIHVLRASRPNIVPHDGLQGDRHVPSQTAPR